MYLSSFRLGVFPSQFITGEGKVISIYVKCSWMRILSILNQILWARNTSCQRWCWNTAKWINSRWRHVRWWKSFRRPTNEEKTKKRKSWISWSKGICHSWIELSQSDSRTKISWKLVPFTQFQYSNFWFSFIDCFPYQNFISFLFLIVTKIVFVILLFC